MATNQEAKAAAGEGDEGWSVTSLLMKAYTLVEQKELGEAQEILERVLKREPENELVLKYQQVLEAAQKAAEEESSSEEEDEEDDDDEGEGEEGTTTEADSSSAESSSPAASAKRAGK